MRRESALEERGGKRGGEASNATSPCGSAALSPAGSAASTVHRPSVGQESACVIARSSILPGQSFDAGDSSCRLGEESSGVVDMAEVAISIPMLFSRLGCRMEQQPGPCVSIAQRTPQAALASVAPQRTATSERHKTLWLRHAPRRSLMFRRTIAGESNMLVSPGQREERSPCSETESDAKTPQAGGR